MDEEFDPEAFISGGDTATETVDPYKQALIQKIQSGATDYTYGPGSPGATSSDMRQKTGARDNALQTGDVALPEKDYNLFTPKERDQLGIADTSWITQGQPTPRGSVERYFGTDAQGFDPKAFITGKPQPIPTPTAVPDIKAFLEPSPTEPEAAPSASTEATPSIGEAIGSGIKGAAQAIGRSAGSIPQFQVPQRQPFVIPQQMQQAPLIGQTPPPIPVPQSTPDMSQQFPLMQQLLPQPMPTPQFQPTQPAPVMQGTIQGLQQTVAGLIPHTMEQFQGLAQVLGAPTDPQGFFKSALQQGLVTSQIAQAAIKAGPLSKEAGLAYGTILPQVLMAAGGLGEAGAIPSVGTVARSLTGQNLLPRAREIGAVGYTGAPTGKVEIQSSQEVPVPESFQPKGSTQDEQTQPPRELAPPSEPPRQPPSVPPPSSPQKPNFSPKLNPVADHGPFYRTYKIDKELGEKMDALGAAPEYGALISETQSRNMLHELTPQQEADVGALLLSDRLRRVNPQHPQVMLDSLARGIESVPANKKAIDYYRSNIEPELEAWGKKAGLKEDAAATQRGAYFTLSPERLQDGTIPELATQFGRTSRTTKYAQPAEGMAAKYSTDVRKVLRESYTERIRKAAARELFDAAAGKGIVEPTPQFLPDPENGPNAGKWVNTIKEQNLPEGIKNDLNLIAQGKATMQPQGIQKILQSYQRGATAVQLGANPLEIQSHMRRQLHILASKPPIGQGVAARLSAILPYFGPKLWAAKRAMSDMSTPARQQILKDITQQGGGSSRAFRETYGTKLPVLKNISDFTNKLLFGYPTGKGVMGWDLRMRVLLEEIRRNAEPTLANDKQRMRQNSNQMGQYGTMASWPVRALRHINPYAGTTLPMRWAELRTLIGGSGLKSASVPEALMRRAETFLRGSGGTIAMLTIANKLLSGNWPWQNRPGHEFDLKTGVKDKQGNDIYVPNRFIAPEFLRAISTLSIPPLLAEQGAPNRSALSETAAATLGPINTGMSLVNSPALAIAAAAGPQWALHAEKFPGQKSLDIMKVGQYTNKDRAAGVPPLLKRAEGVAEQVHPALASILGYMDEPIKGLKPLGAVSVDTRRGYSSPRSRTSQSGRGSGGRSYGRGQGGR